MPQVPFTAFYLGPLAVYPANTGLIDPITGSPERGGNFYVGNYADLSQADANVWNSQYSPVEPLYAGRYRIVKLNTTCPANVTGFGLPVAWAQGSSVQQVALSAAGTGGTAGTYIASSTTSGGTAKATAQIVVGASGGIISATLLYGGAGFTSVPTFGLSEVTGLSAGSVLAQMLESANLVQTYDSSAIAIAQPRGIQLTSATTAQIAAGAYVIIQEAGISNVKVSVATSATAGAYAAATVNAQVTTTAPATAFPIGFLGTTLDLAAANTFCRVALDLAQVGG